MVANLSAGKRGWDDKIQYFSDFAEQGQALKDQLLHLVDEDTAAFNKIIEAVRLPKSSPEEKAARATAMNEATKYAINVPLQIMKTSMQAYPFLKTMAKEGNPNSVSDAGVGALACRTAVHGAYLNVRINCADFEDQAFVEKVMKTADRMLAKSEKECSIIMKVVNKVIG